MKTKLCISVLAAALCFTPALDAQDPVPPPPLDVEDEPPLPPPPESEPDPEPESEPEKLQKTGFSMFLEAHPNLPEELKTRCDGNKDGRLDSHERNQAMKELMAEFRAWKSAHQKKGTK